MVARVNLSGLANLKVLAVHPTAAPAVVSVACEGESARPLVTVVVAVVVVVIVVGAVSIDYLHHLTLPSVDMPALNLLAAPKSFTSKCNPSISAQTRCALH